MLSLFIFAFFAIPSPPVSLPTKEFKSFDISPYLYSLDRDISPDQVLSSSSLSQFKPVEPHTKLIGGNWIQVRLSNLESDRKKFYLEITNTVYFDKIELYKQDGKALTYLGITGDPIHHSLRPTKDHELVFIIELLPNTTNEFFLYIKSPFSFNPSMSVWTNGEFDRKNKVDDLIYVFIYGLLTFVILLTLFMAISFRSERIYLFYSLYLLCMLLIYLHINGFGFEFIWTQWPEFDKRMPFVAISLSMVFLLKFTEKFLRVRQFDDRFQKLFNFTFYALCGSAIYSQFIFLQEWMYKSYLVGSIFFLNLFFYVIAWYAALKSYRSGFKPALFYLVAFLFLFTGILVFLSRSFTALPVNAWLGQHAIQVGNMIEITILTLGLAYWVKINNDEKQLLLIRINDQQKELWNEKDRIARDLHDNIGSQLTSLSLGLNRLTKSGSPHKDQLDILYRHTSDTILELRDTIWIINKSEVWLEEVVDKINNLIWRLRQQDSEMTYTFTAVTSIPRIRLQPAIAKNLFRIVQEAINNSMKHSKASDIEICLSLTDNMIVISIEDNGAGFNTAEHPEGNGLHNMKKRALEINGLYTLHSQPGKGTKVTLQVVL